MSLLTATISGQFVRPDLGRSPVTATIEAVADGGRLTYAGQVIVGRFGVKIASDGTASVTLPQIPQTGLLPSGARWRLTIGGGGAPMHAVEFTLSGNTTWDAIVDVSNVPLTSSLVAEAEAARDAAIAAAASVAYLAWQPTTAYTSGQTVQAPDGSLIKSLSARTSRSSFDATEQTNWKPVSTTSGTLDQLALTDAEIKAAFARGPKIDDLKYPLSIAHRGAADIEAENTVASFRNAVALGYMAVEAGDVQALGDGTLAIMHDGTVDRTTTGTGNVNSFTKATWAALSVDIQTQQGGSYVAQPAPTWDDALTALAGKCVLVPEVKDGIDATATAMCDRADALGARDSIIMTSFVQSNMNICAARGYKTMCVAGSFALLPTLSSLKSNNIWSVCVDYTAADFNATNVTAYRSAGFRVFAYTVDHRVNAAALITMGVDGFYTNEGPYYETGDTSKYLQTRTNWDMTGRFETGIMTNGVGPQVPAGRGSLIGAPGSWRLTPPYPKWVTVGSISPVANAASTYTVTASMTVETMPSDTTQGPSFCFAVQDDSLQNDGANIENGYLAKMRCNGTLQVWAVSNTGAATSLGTKAYTALNNLTTTAALTAGTAYTSISVSALPTALKIGHQFMLPTGQIVTLTANALVSATSITVASVTPTATVASGSALKAYVTISANVTPTTVTCTRVDESATGNVSGADTSQRGGWVVLSAAAFATGLAGFHKLVVT